MLNFIHDGDAHLDCQNVTLGVHMHCLPGKRVGALSGFKAGCHWDLSFSTKFACPVNNTRRLAAHAAR
jgi:hypothetical protein